MPSSDLKAPRRSLKGEATFLFATLAIPLLILQAWWSYHDYQSAREQAWDDALAYADAVDLGVRQFIAQAEQLVRASAARSGEAWLADGVCAPDFERVRELLPFDNVLLVRAEGWISCAAAPVPPDATAAGWPWYESFRASERFTIADPVQADFTGSWILPLVAPIHDRETGAYLGALVGTIPLASLSDLLGGLHSAGDQLATLATESRMVIARSVDADQWVGRSLPPPTGSDRLIAPGRWVAEGPDLTGVQRTWGQVETESGWIVYVGVPDAVVFGPARREALGHVGLTLLVVLLGVFLATRSYSRIARALRQLAERTRAADVVEAVPLPPDTPREISEVVEQFKDNLQGRALAEQAERSARERYQSIFDNAIFGIYVSTPDGRFLKVNPALVDMLGYESEEKLIEAGPTRLYADPGHRQRLIETSLRSGRVETDAHELEWVRADGTPIVVRVTGKLIEGPDGDPVFEMIVQDVTEEKRTEDQLRQTQKMEAIGQLAGGVAHDFNNLLTVIGGNVELLENDLDEADPIRADLDQIAKATHRASALTRRLLSFSRPSRLGEQAVDLDEVVTELAKMLVPLIGETVALVTDIEPGVHRVWIDPGELEQILVNLVLNARDAMPGGGRITISARREERELRGHRVDAVGLIVADDGAGMDDETLRRIFEPFFTTKPMGQGTGLGLASVYGIVHRAGGEIEVDSEPGRGTRMAVWFPATTAEQEIARPEAPHLAVSGTETILVVEDDELVRSFVGRTLRDAGFDVQLADSGGTALDFLRTRTDPIHLVLTDVVMPGMSGPELAGRLRLESPDTPILFMSGYIESAFFDEEMGERPGDLLRKPFSPLELRRRVREAIDRGTRAATAG